MADASGLIISAIAISFQVASTLYGYGQQVKGARKEIRALGNELYGLIGVLEHLKAQHGPRLLEDEETLADKSEYSDFLESSRKLTIGNDHGSTIADPMERPRMTEIISVLSQTLEFLKELQQSLSEPQGRLAVAVQLLKWPLKQGEMENHLKRLERVKTFFVLTLMTDEIDQSRIMYDEITALRTVVEEYTSAQESHKSHQEYLDILQWLSPVDPDLRRKDLSQARTEGTGVWLTQSREIHDWADLELPPGKTLWLNGITGAGKSTLTTAIVDQLLSADPHRRDVAFFYCSFSDDQSLHTENIFGSLIAQTLLPSDVAYNEIKAVYDRGRAKSVGKPQRPEVKILLNLLRSQAQSLGHLFILVDGVNECGDPAEVLTSLREIASSTSGVRLFISSINDKGIDTELSSFPGLSIHSVRPAKMSRDIVQHVQHTLAMHSRLRQLPPSLKNDILHALTRGAEGMFRWVQCQLEILTRLRTPRAVRQALSSMPQTLDKTYEALLSRIDEGEDAGLSKQIFEILAFSFRILTLQEVTTILQITPGMHELDESKLLTQPTDILSICGSFLEYNAKTQVVTLAHHSVKTYLTSNLPASVSAFHLDETIAHHNLALFCLTYLFTIFSTPLPLPSNKISELKKTFPFIEYAVMQWPLHLREISDDNLDPALWNTLQELFSSQNFHKWVELLIPGSTRAPTTAPLYYAASFGLTTVVRYLLKSPGVNIEQRGGWGGATPINIASFRGNLEVVKLLYEAGADPYVTDTNTGLDAAQWAVHKHQPDIVAYFLSKGVRIEEAAWIKDSAMKMIDGKWRLTRPEGSHDLIEIEPMSYRRDHQEISGHSTTLMFKK